MLAEVVSGSLSSDCRVYLLAAMTRVPARLAPVVTSLCVVYACIARSVCSGSVLAARGCRLMPLFVESAYVLCHRVKWTELSGLLLRLPGFCSHRGMHTVTQNINRAVGHPVNNVSLYSCPQLCQIMVDFWATVCDCCLSVCWCIVAKRLDASRCHLIRR